MKFHGLFEYILTPLEKGKRQEKNKYSTGGDKMSIEGESMKEIFQDFQQQFGRCIGKVYSTTKDEERDIHIGWVFEKKDEYERDYRDNSIRRKFFIQETWISLYDPCSECGCFGYLPHEIIHPPWPAEEQTCTPS
ncbi:MAG: hypothetical protein BV458_12360 [Thermoplasmata archaeon M9B2D]|nr:MAG: hypothetical protein BV458_12360 [Thermoplasmata archaeon M9B2D]